MSLIPGAFVLAVATRRRYPECLLAWTAFVLASVVMVLFLFLMILVMI